MHAYILAQVHRTSRRVHIHIFIYTYSTSEATCTQPTLSYIYSALSFIVRTWCPVLGTRLHSQLLLRPLPGNHSTYATIELHEPQPALDASRVGWRCKQEASTDVLRVEIDGVSLACKGQTSAHTQGKYFFLHTHVVGKRSRTFLTGTCTQWTIR